MADTYKTFIWGKASSCPNSDGEAQLEPQFYHLGRMVEARGSCNSVGLWILRAWEQIPQTLDLQQLTNSKYQLSLSQANCQGPECWVVSGAEAELQGLEKDTSHILHLRENQVKLDRQLWDVGWMVLFLLLFCLCFLRPLFCV